MFRFRLPIPTVRRAGACRRDPIGPSPRQPPEKPMNKVIMAIGVAGLIAIVAGPLWYLMDSRYRKLEHERDQLLAQNQQYTRDMAALEADLSRLQSEAATLASKGDSLASEGDAVRRQRDTIAGERDAAAGERDSLRKAQAETV